MAGEGGDSDGQEDKEERIEAVQLVQSNASQLHARMHLK
jgi:hypothetical protein